MTVIDSHVHVFAADGSPYPWTAALHTRPDFNAPVESLVEMQDRAGVSYAVLVQHSCYGYDNRYLLDCVRRYPVRFRAMVKVDPLDPVSPDELRRFMGKDGVRGLRLHLSLDPQATWLAAPESNALWEAAADTGAIVGILLEPHQLRQAETMIRRFPQVSVIIDHMGRVDLHESPEQPHFQTLLRLAHYPNTYVKVSGFYAFSQQGFPYLDLKPYVEALWQAFGPQRLMWATDFPLLIRARETYRQALTILDYQLPQATGDERAWLMGETANHLFRFNAAD